MFRERAENGVTVESGLMGGWERCHRCDWPDTKNIFKHKDNRNLWDVLKIRHKYCLYKAVITYDQGFYWDVQRLDCVCKFLSRCTRRHTSVYDAPPCKCHNDAKQLQATKERALVQTWRKRTSTQPLIDKPYKTPVCVHIYHHTNISATKLSPMSHVSCSTHPSVEWLWPALHRLEATEHSTFIWF